MYQTNKRGVGDSTDDVAGSTSILNCYWCLVVGQQHLFGSSSEAVLDVDPEVLPCSGHSLHISMVSPDNAWESVGSISGSGNAGSGVAGGSGETGAAGNSGGNWLGSSWSESSCLIASLGELDVEVL